MVPPEASACMLWGGMNSCAQHHNNNCLERLVLRSAPHVFRRGRYKCPEHQKQALVVMIGLQPK